MELYSPAAIDTAPAIRPARPARRTTLGAGSAPATPRISPTFETSPSLTPKTAARAAPPCMSRWWWISTGLMPGSARDDIAASLTRCTVPPGLPLSDVPSRYDIGRDELAALLPGQPAYRV